MGKKVVIEYCMRKIISCALLLCWMLIGGVSHAQETILLTNGEWPPYQSPTFRHGGLITRITTEAFAQAEITVEYDYLPWKRALKASENPPYVGSIAWRKMGDIQKQFFYSEPLLDDEIVFFHRKGMAFDWDDMAQRSGLRVGLSLGYLYNEPITEAVKKAGGSVDIAPTELSCFQKLLMNRVDVVPASINVGYYLLQTNFLRGQSATVTHAPKPFMSTPLHLLISRKHENGRELIERFNTGLQAIKRDGRYAQFIDESLRGEYQP